MAQLQKGTTYLTGDQVTAANLNALVDSGLLIAGAITDQTAKTVPLAADTILLHSAADTALRKTTMTQLFATPQPLGATTPSSVAATTGTFSSTLGVTGVATLGNGAILGTPASGTVTNLTGTASININGTVGATTPSTGSFTTVATTGTITQAGFPNTLIYGTSSAASALISAAGSSGDRWQFGAGILNAGDWGATNVTRAVNPIVITGGTTSPTTTFYNNAGAQVVQFSATGAAITGTLSATGTLTLARTGNDAVLNFQNSNVTEGQIECFAGEMFYQTQTAGKNHVFRTDSGTVRATISSTGLAITGALSATGITSLTGAARLTGSVGGLGSGAGLELGYSSSSGSINSYDRTNNVYYPLTVTGSTMNFAPSGSGVLLVSAGAVAITGALSCTGALAIGNTVAAAVAVASTHKVTVVIGGVTYYLLATNV